jgi:hypothetical protein
MTSAGQPRNKKRDNIIKGNTGIQGIVAKILSKVTVTTT